MAIQLLLTVNAIKIGGTENMIASDLSRLSIQAVILLPSPLRKNMNFYSAEAIISNRDDFEL